MFNDIHNHCGNDPACQEAADRAVKKVFAILGLDVDKGQGKYGWYFIRCARDGAFSLRWCKQVGPKVLSFEAGWLLDVYVKSPANAAKV